MNNDFKILVDFLGGLGPEVSGRVLDRPEGDAARKLDRFASGGITAGERREVCAMLQRNPVWLRYLAERVKESRGVGTGEGSEGS